MVNKFFIDKFGVGPICNNFRVNSPLKIIDLKACDFFERFPQSFLGLIETFGKLPAIEFLLLGIDLLQTINDIVDIIMQLLVYLYQLFAYDFHIA